jgi:hypothetical protein
MNNILKTIVITFSFVTINSICSAQTNEADTTKKGVPGGKTEAKAKKMNGTKFQKDTLAPQNKITVNEDGVESRKKIKRKKYNSNDSTETIKANEKMVIPKKEE